MLHCPPAVWFASTVWCGSAARCPLLKRFHRQLQRGLLLLFYSARISPFLPSDVYSASNISLSPDSLPEFLLQPCICMAPAWRSRLWWPLRCSDILAAGLLVPSSSPITHPGIPLRLLLCSMLRVVTLKCSCGKHVCICVLHGIFYCLDACVAICKYPSSCVTEQKIKGDRGGNACLFLFGDLKACLPIFGTNLWYYRYRDGCGNARLSCAWPSMAQS